jgi:hypothetical protein
MTEKQPVSANLDLVRSTYEDADIDEARAAAERLADERG